MTFFWNALLGGAVSAVVAWSGYLIWKRQQRFTAGQKPMEERRKAYADIWQVTQEADAEIRASMTSPPARNSDDGGSAAAPTESSEAYHEISRRLDGTADELSDHARKPILDAAIFEDIARRVSLTVMKYETVVDPGDRVLILAYLHALDALARYIREKGGDQETVKNLRETADPVLTGASAELMKAFLAAQEARGAFLKKVRAEVQ